MLSRLLSRLLLVVLSLVGTAFLVTPAQAQQAEYEVSFARSNITAEDFIDVHWTVPANRTTRGDWIGIYRTGAADRSYVTWKYVPGPETSGTLTFGASEAGTYEVRIFAGSGYTRAAVGPTTLTIGAGADNGTTDPGPGNPPASGSYALTVDAGPYALQESVTVQFSTPSPRPSGSSWIGIYEIGASDRSYVAWKYIPSTDTFGSLTFQINQAGTYEARLFADGGYTRVATAGNTFVVGGTTPTPTDPLPDTGSYTLAVEAGQYAIGETITIQYTTPSPRTTRNDWIGIHRTDASDRSYVAWKYIPSTGTSGNLTFQVNSAGTYEARLFSGSGYTRVAVTDNTFTVGETTPTPTDPLPDTGSYTLAVEAGQYALQETVVVQYTTPSPRTTRNDWIGIYRTDASDRSYVAWKYLPSTGTSGSLTFQINQAGTYEARIFSGSGYTRVAVTNNTFTVGETTPAPTDPPPENGGSDTYTLSLSATSITLGQSVTVSYQAPASANRRSDWVSMTTPGASNRTYNAWQYISSGASGSLTFTPATAGTYEFRYFKNDGYTRVATSPTLTVIADGSGGGTGAQCVLSESELSAITNYPPDSGEVVAFGDSLTAGNGASSGQDYVSHLSRKSGATIINAGVSGDTTRDALARLQSDVLSRDPSVVIVWLGGNDILQRYYDRLREGAENPGIIETIRLLIMRITGKLPDSQGITEDETFANLQTIVERIQARGAVVIVVGFSGGIFDTGLENRYREVATETGAIYVPNALQNIIGRFSLMSDLVHPNGTGYDRVADRILPYFACVMP